MYSGPISVVPSYVRCDWLVVDVGLEHNRVLFSFLFLCLGFRLKLHLIVYLIVEYFKNKRVAVRGHR